MATASSDRGDAAASPGGIEQVRDAGRRAEAAPDEASAVACIRPLFEDIGWLRAIARHAADRLGEDPLHLFGLTALSSGPLQQLLFVSGARLSITLGILGGGQDPLAPPPATASFGGNRSLLRSLSPDRLAGRLAMVSRRDGLCRDRAITLRPGQILDLDESRQALWIAPPARPLLFLRARLRRSPAPLVRSQAIGSAVPASLANGDDGLARSLALVEVLRALGTRPPVEDLRALLPRAHGRQRWALMREMLAADTPAAWPDLAAMARDEPDAAVRAAAAALLARFPATPPSPGTPQPCPV